MSSLEAINNTLQEQTVVQEQTSNNIADLRDRIADMLSLQENRRGDELEKQIEERQEKRKKDRISKSKPTGLMAGISSGLNEGFFGIPGLLQGIFGGIGGGAIAGTAAALLTKFLTRGAFIGVLAAFGEDLIKGLFDTLDPNDIVMSDESKEKFAEALNLSAMAGLTLGTIGRLFGKKFGLLLGVGGAIATGLYSLLENSLDGSELEKKFNKEFGTEFGSEIMGGFGALVGTALALSLGNQIRNVVRNYLGISAPKTAAGATRGGRPSGVKPPIRPTSVPKAAVPTGMFGGPAQPKAPTPANIAAAPKSLPKLGPTFNPLAGMKRTLAGAVIAYGISKSRIDEALVSVAEAQKDFAEKYLGISREGVIQMPSAPEVFDMFRSGEMQNAANDYVDFLKRSMNQGETTFQGYENYNQQDFVSAAQGLTNPAASELAMGYNIPGYNGPANTNNIVDASQQTTIQNVQSQKVQLSDNFPAAVDNHYARQYMGIPGFGFTVGTTF